MKTRFFAYSVAMASFASVLHAQATSPVELSPPGIVSASFKDLLPFFSPPDPWKEKFGSFRTVMKFDDGAEVKTPADWPRRRAEILKYWQAAMGAWPALLDKPRAREELVEHIGNFTRRKLQLETAADKFQTAYLHVPDGEGPFPAVIVVFYDAESGAGLVEKRRGQVDWGSQLCGCGFVTLSLGASPAGPTTVQRLSWLAYCAANANTYLRTLPNVNPARVGIIGHSFGGKWAMFASCLDERFACAVWCDPGVVWNEKDPNANYWEPWYLGFDGALAAQRKPGVPTDANPRTGPYKQFVAKGDDLNQLHALMAPRPFLVSGGAQDRLEHWPALNNVIALNKFLGFENRVAMTQRAGHTPTAASNAQVIAFFKHFLKDGVERGQ